MAVGKMIAETELSVLSEQFLKRRISSVEELKREVDAWQKERNDSEAKVAQAIYH